MEILGELLDLCKEQNIGFTDPESFYYIQIKNNTSEDRSKIEDDTKIKGGIDLLTKREPEGMKFLFVGHIKSLIIFQVDALRD